MPAAEMSVEFGLKQVGTVDAKKGLILFYDISHFGEGICDAALILRENLGQQILVEVYIADLPILWKRMLADRSDLDGGELCVGKHNAWVRSGGHAR